MNTVCCALIGCHVFYHPQEAATPTVTGQASQTSPARGEGILEDSPPPSMDDLIAFGDALRRSPRRRAKTVKFAAKDFKEKPDNPRGDRKSRRRRSASHDQEGDCEAVQQMHDEFEALKVLQLGAIRSQKMEERRKVMEEKAERRESERHCKEEVRQERAREREAQGRRRGEKRLQLRLARGIVREAQRERLRRDRERTRVRKQTELQELKQRKAEEKRRKQVRWGRGGEGRGGEGEGEGRGAWKSSLSTVSPAPMGPSLDRIGEMAGYVKQYIFNGGRENRQFYLNVQHKAYEYH